MPNDNRFTHNTTSKLRHDVFLDLAFLCSDLLQASSSSVPGSPVERWATTANFATIITPGATEFLPQQRTQLDDAALAPVHFHCLQYPEAHES